MIWNWLLHVIGVLPRTPSSAYNFWSGFASDLGEAGLITVVVHHLNCHVKGCPRPGLHKVDGTPYATCKRHHPVIDHTERVTPATIRQAHEDASTAAS